MLGMGGGGTGNMLGGIKDLGPIQATGGDTYTPGDGYKYHKYEYNSPSTFVISTGQGTLEVATLAAGGGGGGGSGNGGNNPGGGGGGGGGTLQADIEIVGAMTCPVTVGNKGNAGGGGGGASNGNQGGNSVFTVPFGNITSTGGGGGSGGPQGLGGGAGTNSNTSTPKITVNDDYDGGNGGNKSSGSGGAGGPAGFRSPTNHPQASKWYYPYFAPGQGASDTGHSSPAPSANNYGAGGAGGTGSWDGGAGQPGSNGTAGRVVIRYLITNP